MVFADDWGRHPSSCQHLIARLRERMPVLWVNTIGTRQVKANFFTLRRGVEKISNWLQGVKQVAPQMWTIDVPMLPGLGNPLLLKINRTLVSTRLHSVQAKLELTTPLVLTTLPYVGWLIRDLPRLGLVYYCTDDYRYWPSADREILQRADLELTEQADLILAVSQALVSSHAHTGRCNYFPHAVDYPHFAVEHPPSAVPPALAQLPGPRIGYFGLIYEMLDYELLTAVARQNPGGSLVLLGPRDYCPAEFASLPNVHLLGPKPYAELPRWLAGLDVLLLPYRDDPMIRQSGPLKLRECLATGKPTVSIDVPEVRPFQPHVRVGATQERFLEHVREALAEAKEGEHVLARRRAVEPDSWDDRARVLYSFLVELEATGRKALPGPRANGHVHQSGCVVGTRDPA
jgi:glycosyltransferase involved in cell wall biosynthesis